MKCVKKYINNLLNISQLFIIIFAAQDSGTHGKNKDKRSSANDQKSKEEITNEGNTREGQTTMESATYPPPATSSPPANVYKVPL